MEVQNHKTQSRTSKWLVIFSLVFAGEMIFSLPFHVARFFRPTLLSAFNLTNSNFGDILSVYGIMAMLAYFPGGIIADRFSARKLMSASLFATALGGVYMTFMPHHLGLGILYGYWGITTIFLFWAAMIKATREWGGKLNQGKAFGILDGGRGLAAATIATIAVFILSRVFPDDINSLSDHDRIAALKSVIWLYVFMTSVAGLFVWFIIPENTQNNKTKYANPLNGMREVIHNRNVWLQAIIVVSAYCGYKGLDYYSLYAVDVLGMNELEAARFMSITAYLRPVSAVTAGFIVDRLSAKKVIIVSFILLIISYTILSILNPESNIANIIFTNIIITFMGVYALRGVYFALIQETKIPARITGTAVGLISLIGYTPDVFFNSIAGRILDGNPGFTGYQNYFIMLAGISILGLLATFALATSKKVIDK